MFVQYIISNEVHSLDDWLVVTARDAVGVSLLAGVVFIILCLAETSTSESSRASDPVASRLHTLEDFSVFRNANHHDKRVHGWVYCKSTLNDAGWKTHFEIGEWDVDHEEYRAEEDDCWGGDLKKT